MTDSVKQSRRTVLKAFASLLLYLPIARQLSASLVQPTDLLKMLSTIVADDTVCLKEIGVEYLKTKPHESDRESLLRLVCADIPKTDAALNTCHADVGELREYLAKQITSDFENGQTTSVKGWVLANTELRLCALTCLS